MQQTLYLILTADGFTEAKEAIFRDNSLLWINPSVLDEMQLKALSDAKIAITVLDKPVRLGDEKATLDIIKSIEKKIKDVNILVEYL
jgi:hypothetical protein